VIVAQRMPMTRGRVNYRVRPRMRGMGADALQSSDPAVFAQQCAAVGASVSNAGGIPHCVLNSSALPNDPTGANGIADQFPPGFNPNAPAVPGAVSINSYMANPAGGGCAVIDLGRNLCMLGNDPYPCNGIRECDSLTNAVHKELALPSGIPTGNVDINVVGPSGTTYVGNPNAGKSTAKFTTSPTSGPQSNAPGSTPVGGGVAQSNAPNAAVAVPSGAAASSSIFGSIPWWVWLAGAGGIGILAFAGGRR